MRCSFLEFDRLSRFAEDVYPIIFQRENETRIKRGIQDFYMNYVLVPADKATYNVIVV